MSELPASNKHIPLSLCAFTTGKENSFRKLSEVWSRASGLAPPPPSSWHSTGETCLVKRAEWILMASSVKEGCPKPGEMSQQLGSGPGSQRGKELGQQVWERKEDFVFTPAVSPNQWLRDEENNQEEVASEAEGALERWVTQPLHPPLQASCTQP